MQQNKKQLLVYGYIRDIQSLLNKDNIIPYEVINICYHFSLKESYIFIKCDGDENEFILFDINNNKFKRLISKIADINFKIDKKTLCFIPQISKLFNHSILLSNKEYDGFICQSKSGKNKQYRYLIVFESLLPLALYLIV